MSFSALPVARISRKSSRWAPIKGKLYGILKELSGRLNVPLAKPCQKIDYFLIKFISLALRVESPEYNPALGQVVKNSKHRKDLAKEKGLIEIGNEPVEKIHKKFDSDRAEKLKKAWEDV
jgi:hypothetical protein